MNYLQDREWKGRSWTRKQLEERGLNHVETSPSGFQHYTIGNSRIEITFCLDDVDSLVFSYSGLKPE